jgi:hypothetical protein
LESSDEDALALRDPSDLHLASVTAGPPVARRTEQAVRSRAIRRLVIETSTSGIVA